MSTMLKIWIWLLAATFLLHCTRNSEEPQNRQRIDARSHPLTFDHEKVEEIEINTFDPRTAQSWSVRASKKAERLGPRAPDWEIEPFLDGSQFVDKKANGKFIEHLLDTFQTLEVMSNAPAANEQTYGLKPALFDLQWKQGNQRFHIKVGAPISPEREERYATFPGRSDDVYVVRGAALKMLSYIKSASTFRLEKWIPLNVSQVRSFEVNSPRSKGFGAKRVSGKWQTTSKLGSDQIQDLLDRLLHLRVADFIDSVPLSKSLLENADSTSTHLIKLWDRKSNLTQVKAFKSGKNYYGTVSDRPEALFLLPGDVSRYFDPTLTK